MRISELPVSAAALFAWGDYAKARQNLEEKTVALGLAAMRSEWYDGWKGNTAALAFLKARYENTDVKWTMAHVRKIADAYRREDGGTQPSAAE